MPDLQTDQQTDSTDNRAVASRDADGTDPLTHLHKMSTTAGLGSTDYVAINGPSVVAVILGLASALAVVATILLIVPIAGVICAAVALYQVGKSGGTQTGRGLAILGLLLSLGFAAYVGYAGIAKARQESRDQAAIELLITDFTGHAQKSEFDQAYALFSPRFQERVTPQQFTDTMRYVREHPTYGKLQGITTNGRYDFTSDPATGVRIGQAILLMQLDKIPDLSRMEAVFRLVGGQWKFDNIPSMFPAPQQQQG